MLQRCHKRVAFFVLACAVADVCVTSLFCVTSPLTTNALFLLHQQQTTASVGTVGSSQQSGAPAEDDCLCCSTHIAATPRFQLAALMPLGVPYILMPDMQVEGWPSFLYRPPRA